MAMSLINEIFLSLTIDYTIHIIIMFSELRLIKVNW